MGRWKVNKKGKNVQTFISRLNEPRERKLHKSFLHGIHNWSRKRSKNICIFKVELFIMEGGFLHMVLEQMVARKYDRIRKQAVSDIWGVCKMI